MQVTKDESEKNLKLEISRWENMFPNRFSSKELMLPLIKSFVINEKSYLNIFRNKQYTFDVSLKLNKTQIKKLFENLLQVQIIAVNTSRPPRSSRKQPRTYSLGYKPRYKRVTITLKNSF